MTSIVVILLGIVSLISMKRGLMTVGDSGRVRVEAYVDGGSPSEMERFVTFPIEQAIKNLEGIDSIRSRSQDGRSVINIETLDDFQDYSALVEEIDSKIANIRGLLPDSIRDIKVEHRKRTEQWLGGYALLNFDEESDEHQKWIAGFKERLLRVDGVVNAYTRFRTKQLYVRFDAEKLARYRINLSDAFVRVRQAFRLNPVGGFQKNGEQFFVQMANQSEDLSQINSIVIKSNYSGRTIHLEDVAKAEYRLSYTKTSDFLVNGKKNASFFIMADIKADLIEVTKRLHAFMDKEKAKFPKGIEAIKTGDGSAFIERQINALKTNSIYGAILVFIVLCFSLGVRNSLMTSFGIPLAYGATFIVLDMVGIQIDLVSIIGMLLVLGILVDDSIIVSEKHAQYLEEGKNATEAATLTVLSMWVPITGTVLTTIVAFAPFLVGHDMVSVMMRAIPIVVVTALLASLFECFFILPNHLAHFVKKPKSHGPTAVGKAITKFYRKSLSLTIKLRYLFLFGFLGFSIWTGFFAKDNLKTNFNLNINEETVTVAGAVKKTTGTEDTLKQLMPVVKSLNEMDKDKYKHYTVQVSGIWIQGSYKEGAEYFLVSVVFSQLDNEVSTKKKYVERYLKDKLDTFKKSGVFERIEISRKIQGDDEAKSDALQIRARSAYPFDTDQIAKSLNEKLKEQNGIMSIDMDESNKVETWEFKPDDSEMMSYGLTRQAVSSQLRGHVSLTNIYEYRGGVDLYTIYGLVKEGSEQTFESLSETPIILANGNVIKVSEVGRWEKKYIEQVIRHYNLRKSTKLIIPFDKDKITEANLITEVEKKIETLQSSYPNVTFTVSNADEQVRKNKTTMSKKFLYSVIAIFFILCVILKSIYQPLLICLSIPFGLVGVVWAFYMQDLTLDIMACIGVIGMAGVVVNDALILVNTVNQMRVSWSSFSASILEKACSTRLRPIILTSVTTLGGLFPMAYGLGGDSGFTKPLAMSMAWGLFFATFLTLFLIPACIMIQGDFIRVFNKLSNKFMKKNSSKGEDGTGGNLKRAKADHSKSSALEVKISKDLGLSDQGENRPQC